MPTAHTRATHPLWLLLIISLLAGAAHASDALQKAKDAVFQLKVEGANGMAVTGTGFLISRDGLAVTNFHVIQGASSARALFPGHSVEVPVELVHVDPGVDLALLRIPVSEPQLKGKAGVIEVRRDPTVEGLDVWALGFPHLGFTVTRGIVSGLRSYPELPERLRVGLQYDERSRWVQTDCTINSGNSGGPLIDTAGRLVGVNTWVWLEGANVFFALDSSHVLELTKNAPETPIGFSHELVKRPSRAPRTLPSLTTERRAPAQTVLSASNSLRSRVNCSSCRGQGTRIITVDGANSTGPRVRLHERREVPCQRCEGTGDGPTPAILRAAGDLALALARMNPEDPRADHALDFARRAILDTTHRNPQRLAVALNNRAVEQLTDTKVQPGAAVVLIGVLIEEAAFGDGAERIQLIGLINKELVVGVTDPQIVRAARGDVVLVLSTLAGRITTDRNQLLPVLSGGAVVGPDE